MCANPSTLHRSVLVLDARDRHKVHSALGNASRGTIHTEIQCAYSSFSDYKHGAPSLSQPLLQSSTSRSQRRFSGTTLANHALFWPLAYPVWWHLSWWATRFDALQRQFTTTAPDTVAPHAQIRTRSSVFCAAAAHRPPQKAKGHEGSPVSFRHLAIFSNWELGWAGSRGSQWRGAVCLSPNFDQQHLFPILSLFSPPPATPILLSTIGSGGAFNFCFFSFFFLT